MSHELPRNASANANNAGSIELQTIEIAKQLVSEVSRWIEYNHQTPVEYNKLMLEYGRKFKALYYKPQTKEEREDKRL